MRDVVGRAARRMLYMLLKRVVRASMLRLALEDFGVPDVARLTAHRIVLLERNFRCTQKAKVSAGRSLPDVLHVVGRRGDMGVVRASMLRLALEDFGVPDVARLTAHRIVS